MALTLLLLVCASGATSAASQPAPGGDALPDDEPAEPRVLTVESVPLGGIDAQAAALLISGQSGGEVDGALVWTVTGFADDASEATVPLIVGLDAQSLLGGTENRRVPVEFYGYLIDGAGAVVRHIAEGVVLDNRPESGWASGARLRFIGEFQLRPGLYSVRIMVRNHTNGRFFLARKDLSVPGGDGEGLFLLPPLVEPESPEWVNVRQHGLDTPSVVASLPGLKTWPSARPILKEPKPLDLVIGCSGLDDVRRLTVRLVNVVGRSIQTLDLRVDQQLDVRGAVSFYRVSIPAIDLPSGRYRLVVGLADTDTGRSVSQSLAIVLGSNLEELLQASRPTATLPGSATEYSGEALQAAEISASYEDALRLFAAGDTVQGREALAELERRVVSQSPTRHWSKLRDAELRAAVPLVKQEPDSVLALILVHRDMYGWYRRHREPGLAEHSWTLAAAMAEGTSTVPGWEAPEGFVPCVLLDFAGDLVQQGDVGRARSLLERAVDVAPNEAATRFALAVVHELSGQRYEAARQLERLLDDHPDHYEGRLRLAINKFRLGSGRIAERLFRELLEEPAPEWIVTLAYQELAQLLVTEGRSVDALELLREGVSRLPGNQRLRIELAYVLDTVHSPRDAAAIVETIETAGGQFETSPRVRYSEWPVLESERVCGGLESARSDGLAALERAVQ
jgi:tetratricopeptide (TPR) repeat protein